MKRKKRPKNICKCGKKLEKQWDECINCGGVEFYSCPDLDNCGKEYTLNGEEL